MGKLETLGNWIAGSLGATFLGGILWATAAHVEFSLDMIREESAIRKRPGLVRLFDQRDEARRKRLELQEEYNGLEKVPEFAIDYFTKDPRDLGVHDPLLDWRVKEYAEYLNIKQGLASRYRLLNQEIYSIEEKMEEIYRGDPELMRLRADSQKPLFLKGDSEFRVPHYSFSED